MVILAMKVTFISFTYNVFLMLHLDTKPFINEIKSDTTYVVASFFPYIKYLTNMLFGELTTQLFLIKRIRV